MQYEILKIRENPKLKQEAAQWFHEKWGIALKAYLDSMDECLQNTGAVPQWYIVKNKEKSSAVSA